MLFAVGFASFAGDARAEQHWQLLLKYDPSGVTLIEANPIPVMTKKVRTPGLIYAPVKLACTIEWRDNTGKALMTAPAELPLGLRSTLGDGTPCVEIMPESSVVIVRTTGPLPELQPASLQLTRMAVKGRAADFLPLPTAFAPASLVLPITNAANKSALRDGPLQVEKITDTGPDDNRLVIVILGDGYTAANLAANDFKNDVAGLFVDFDQKVPWDVLLNATNVYRIDVESNEEGADNEVLGVMKDTYLESSFWVNNIERLLALTGSGYSRAVTAANSYVGFGVWDVLLVLTNSTKYGGSGGSIAVSSVHSAASEIVLHELGHSFAGLADEYETPYPGYPPGDGEPNVDYDNSGPALKWLPWVEAGTPLPTPETSPWTGNYVGAFEGARYQSSGIYRPWYNCLMRSLGPDLDPVCREAHLAEFLAVVSMHDELLPPTNSIANRIAIDQAGVTFEVDPLPIPGLTYRWMIEDSIIQESADPTWTHTSFDMADSLQTLRVRILYETELMRLDTVSEVYSWYLERVTSCCLGSTGDIDCSGGTTDIGDLTALIDHLFISFDPLCCPEEANTGGEPDGVVDVGDLTALIDHLMISFDPLPACQ